MTLKKSDKLIAVIGVIILIVAAIGIVLYAGYDNKKEVPIINEENSIKTFEVNYDEITLQIKPDNLDYSIKPKLIGESIWVGNIVLNEQNLKSLNVMIEYHDNYCGFILNKILRPIGADTLTITIYQDDEELAMAQVRGDGIAEIPSISIGSIIPVLTIEAKDLNEAMIKLQEQYIYYNMTYNIQITLKTGLWKMFREMLGMDYFDLKVNYTQFVYDIVIPEDNDDDIPPTGGFEDGTQTWASMSYPGKN